MRYNMQVLDMRYLLIQSGKFMEMRREKTERMNLRSDESRQLIITKILRNQQLAYSDIAQARPKPS